MTPFQRVPLDESELNVDAFMRKFNVNQADAIRFTNDLRRQPVYTNDVYQVIRRDDDSKGLIHLSIRRHDREPVHDWRDLQRIKNELVGPEHEAVELYPAESRVVDTSNQYHLWVLANADERIEMGWDHGRPILATPEQAEKFGGKQRPFGAEQLVEKATYAQLRAGLLKLKEELL